MLQSGLELKLKVLKRNDKGAEFGSQEEGASSEGRSGGKACLPASGHLLLRLE